MQGSGQYLERLKNKMVEGVLEIEPSRRSRFQGFLHRQIRLLYVASTRFVENSSKLQAMALAFKTLLSIAPFLAVTFSVLKAFGVHNRLRPALVEVFDPLGPLGQEITNRLVQFVNNINVKTLGAVGLVALFVTVLSLMGDIERAFNQIWQVKRPRRLARRFSDYLSVLLVGPALLFSALGITASMQSHYLVRQIISLEPFGTMAVALLAVVPYLTICGAFALLYVFVPNTKVSVKSALVGGLMAAVLWETIGWGFAAFVASSTRYYAIYSSFAILLLFLLWLYVGWLVVLFGAEVAFSHQSAPLYQGQRKSRATSAAGRERLGLQIMALIGTHYHLGKRPWTTKELADELHVSNRLVKELLLILSRQALLIEASDDQGYFPSRDLDQIGVKQILDAVRSYGDASSGGEPQGAAAEVIREVDEAIFAALKGKSLKTLVLSQRSSLPASE